MSASCARIVAVRVWLIRAKSVAAAVAFVSCVRTAVRV